MPEGSSAPEQPLKISKNPQTQESVDTTKDSLRQQFPTATEQHLNSQARSKIANEKMIGIIRRMFGKKLQQTEQRANTAEQNSMTDALTGLPNRGWFNQELPRRMAEAKRNGKSVWALMADIDHFKSVNDKFGHPVGDQILKAWGAITARTEEPFARYGGEEFAQILQDGHDPEALQIILSRFSINFGDITEKILGYRATLSYGVARMDPGDTPDSLMQRVDLALYNSKAQGRDRVSISQGATDKQSFTELKILNPQELIQVTQARAQRLGVAA